MEREFNYPFAELIGALTVRQIKEVKKPNPILKDEIQKISHDLDTLIGEKNLKLSAEFIRLVIYLAEMDCHIWYCQDQMDEHPDKYDEWLRMKHQINGLRNQVKGKISDYVGDSNGHTNNSLDGLKWEISI